MTIPKNGLREGDAGYEYCDDGDADSHDGCNDECLHTETESPRRNDLPNNADVMQSRRVVGILDFQKPGG